MKIKIRRNDLFIESTCVICGEEFPPDIIVAAAYNQTGNRSFGEVCPKCIHAGPQAAQQSIREQIQQLRDRAERLLQVAADLEQETVHQLDLPAWAEWREAHLKTFLDRIGLAHDERVWRFRQTVVSWTDPELNTYLNQEVDVPTQADLDRQALYAIVWHERENRRVSLSR